MSLEISEITLPPIKVKSGAPEGIASDIYGISRLLKQSAMVDPCREGDLFARTADMLRGSELDGDQHIVIYEKEGRKRDPRGLLSYTAIDNTFIHIDNLVVDESYRRDKERRYGSKLIDFVLLRAERQGISEILLNADRGAIGFYEKLGFALDDRFGEDLNTKYPLMSRRVVSHDER